ncbi:MAG: peptidoglycan-binding protein [bacterium]|nr:peptidoglycan-binding protein [bacterium]
MEGPVLVEIRQTPCKIKRIQIIMSIKFKKAISTKVAATFLSFSTALFVSGASIAMPLVANAALTESQITSILSLLDSFGVDSATRTNVNASLRGQPTTPAAPSAGACSFTQNLTVGSKGDDVKCLQTYLNVSPQSGYFGPLTKAAVAKWQADNGVSPAAGYFGSVSRAKYSSVAVGAPAAPAAPGAPAAPAPVGTGLSIAAGTQPAASLAPENAVRVPFTVVRLTAGTDGDVTVTSLTVERTGLAADTAISGVTLLDENGNQLGIAKTLNSSHQAAVGEAFTVKAGQTRTVTVAANLDTDLDQEAGQVAYFAVVGVNTSATVSGTLPITGAGHTVNGTLAIGSATMARGATDPGAAQSKEVGTINYTFSAIKVTAGSAEKVYLKSVRWNQTGSAGTGDLKNIKTYVDGTAYDTIVSADGKYYTANFPGTGLLMDKGFSKDLSIKGDVEGGSGRNVAFDIAKRSDLYLVGETYSYGILPPQTNTCGATTGTACFTSSEDPWYDGAVVTVTAGTINVSVSTAVPAQNIAVNLANQLLGAITVDVKGEPISVAAMHFNVDVAGTDSGSDADVDDITNIVLVDANGAIVAGPVDGSATDSSNTSGLSDGSISLTDTITFPIGVNTYTLKGKIGTQIDNNMTVQASTTPSNDFKTVRGQVTGNTVTPTPASAISLSIMTIKAATTTVSVSSIPIAQTVIAGASQFTFANYIFDGTASGEDVRLTSLPLAYDAHSGAVKTDLTNCNLYDGASRVTTGGNVVNPTTSSASSTTYTFDGTGITLSKGTVKTLVLKCDVRSGTAASSQFAWGIDAAGTYSGFTGLVSGQSVTPTINDSTGQYMTASAGGTLTVELDPATPNYTLVAGGQTNIELARIRFRSASEDINLKQVALQLTTTASNTPTDLIGRMVSLYDATNPTVVIGTASFPTADTATGTLTVSLLVPRDGTKTLIVKGDIAAISNSGPLTASGDLLKVDYDGDNEGLNGTYGVGVASGATIGDASTEITGADTAVDGVRIAKSYPTMARVNISSTLVNGIQPVLRWSITANSAGDIGITTLTLRTATTSATVADLNVYVYSDSAFSTAVSVSGRGDGKWMETDYDLDLLAANTDLELDVTNSSNATTTFTIPAGATRYFEARVNVSGADAAGDSVSTQLQGDAAVNLSVTAQYSVARGDANDDFIWSPLSTTTAALDNLDWTNGFQVVGLSSSNMTPQVISR